MNNFISIILPCYNAENFINETIQSVLNQTYKNFELLIVNDGSDDKSVEIIKSIDDKRITLIETDHTGLGSCAINTGIKNATGDFIAIIDADDLWFPEKLAIELSFFESHPDIGMVCSNEFELIEDKQTSQKTSNLVQKQQRTNRFISFKYLFLNTNIVSTSTVVLRKQCLADVGMLSELPSYFSVYDYQLWLRVAQKYPIYFINKPLGYYRIHEKGISKKMDRSVKGVFYVLANLINEVPIEWRSEAIKKVKKTRIGILKYYLKQLKLLEALKWFTESF